MKKLFTLTLICATAALTASCAKESGDMSYQYESQAPYASERTVGTTEQPSAEPVFRSTQRK